MTAPKLSYDTAFGRFYRHPAASRVTSALGQVIVDIDSPKSPKPSITNVIKMMDEGFLPGYHGKLIAEYAIENLDSLKALPPEDAVAKLRSIPDEPHPNADIGTNVHAMIDAFHQGRPVPEGKTITARRMYAQYLHFLSEAKPEVIRTEYTVWSYEHGYAGTGDMLWRFRGLPTVVDFKSGNAIYPKVAMQCAAIQNADVILNEDGTESEMPSTSGLQVVHIRPMSIKLYELSREREAWLAFLACKRLFDWVRFDREFTIPAEPLIKTERPKP